MSKDLQDTDRQIMEINVEISDAVTTLSELMVDLTTKQGAFEVAYAKAYRATVGEKMMVDDRKAEALIATHELKQDVDMAETLVKVHKAYMRSLEQQIDGLRSKGANQRAAWSTEAAGQWT
jgi:hypothetical protein